MLDQGFVAGTGNYLRSEILFTAGLHWKHRLIDLSDGQVRELAAQTIEITRRSYKTRGVTNDPAIAAQMKKSGARRRAYRHFVFDRAERSCHRCGDLIQRVEAAGRRLYYCAHCQPSRGVDGA